MNLRAIVLSVAAIAAAALLHHRDNERDAKTSRVEAELQRLRNSVPTDRHPMPVVHALPAGRSPPTDPLEPSRPRADGETPESGPKPETPREITAEVIHDQLEAAFQREDVDAAWASRSQRLAQDRLTAVVPSTSLVRSIDCRGSMCRIETRHTGRATYQEFFERAFVDPATMLWNGAAHSAILADEHGEAVSVITFLSREHGELPQIE